MIKEEKKIKKWLRGSAGYLAIFLIAGAYLLLSSLTLGLNDKPLDEIITDAVTYVLLGVTMERLFSVQGILNGKSDVRYLSTVQLHGQEVNRVAPWMDLLDGWCVQKTNETLRQIRTRILLRRGMKYESFFDADGVALGYHASPMPEEIRPDVNDTREVARRKRKKRKVWHEEERQRREYYNRALRWRIYPLMSGSLTGGAVNVGDPFDFGRSIAEYEKTKSMESAMLRLLSAVIFGYFGIKLAQDFSWEALAYRAFQVATAVGLGAWQMYRSYLFVVEDLRGNIVKKIDYLQMFGNWAAHERPESGLLIAQESKEGQESGS